jgi:hypothetical protein
MRVVGIVLTLLFGAPFLLFSWLALSSRFEWTAGDVHGYGMLFGTLLAMAISIPLALSVPLIFPTGRRARATLVSLIALVVVDAGLLLALLTA